MFYFIVMWNISMLLWEFRGSISTWSRVGVTTAWLHLQLTDCEISNMLHSESCVHQMHTYFMLIHSNAYTLHTTLDMHSHRLKREQTGEMKRENNEKIQGFLWLIRKCVGVPNVTTRLHFRHYVLKHSVSCIIWIIV